MPQAYPLEFRRVVAVARALRRPREVYGENGEIQTVPSPADPFLNAVFINNCATVTMGLFAGGGQGEGQYTIFST